MQIIVQKPGVSLIIDFDETAPVPYKALFEIIEKDLIAYAMAKTGNNKHRASKELCLQRTTLVEKCRKLEYQFKPRKKS